MEESKEELKYVTMTEYCDMTDLEARKYIKALKKKTLVLRDAVREGKNPLTISALKEHMGMVSVYRANKYRSHNFSMVGVPSSLRRASRSKVYKHDADSIKDQVSDTQ